MIKRLWRLFYGRGAPLAIMCIECEHFVWRRDAVGHCVREGGRTRMHWSCPSMVPKSAVGAYMAGKAQRRGLVVVASNEASP